MMKIYGDFFGEPNGSPHEVSGGFINSHKTYVLCTWLLRGFALHGF